MKFRLRSISVYLPIKETQLVKLTLETFMPLDGVVYPKMMFRLKSITVYLPIKPMRMAKLTLETFMPLDGVV